MIDLKHHQLHISDILDFKIDAYDDLTWYGMGWYAPSPPDDFLSTVTVDDFQPITNDFQHLYLSAS